MMAIAKNINTTIMEDPVIKYNDYMEMNSWKIDDLFTGIIWTKQHETIVGGRLPFVMTWDTGVKEENEIGFLCGEIDEARQKIHLHKMITDPDKAHMYLTILGEFVDAINTNATKLHMGLDMSDLDSRAKLAIMYELNNETQTG
jgi:hypothetical protein